MSQTLLKVQALALAQKVRASRHGYAELAKDGLFFDEVVAAVASAVVVEDYPNYAKGSCVLVLQFDTAGLPVHVLWGLELGTTEPAVLITAYRPDPKRWDPTFMRRLT